MFEVIPFKETLPPRQATAGAVLARVMRAIEARGAKPGPLIGKLRSCATTSEQHVRGLLLRHRPASALAPLHFSLVLAEPLHSIGR